MHKGLIEAGRLALRHEGDMWNAYYALPGTMKDALPLGSVNMGAVIGKGGERRKQQFIRMMMDVVSDLLEEATGIRPEWPDPPRPAPESERAGHS